MHTLAGVSMWELSKGCLNLLLFGPKVYEFWVSISLLTGWLCSSGKDEFCRIFDRYKAFSWCSFLELTEDVSLLTPAANWWDDFDSWRAGIAPEEVCVHVKCVLLSNKLLLYMIPSMNEICFYYYIIIFTYLVCILVVLCIVHNSTFRCSCWLFCRIFLIRSVKPFFSYPSKVLLSHFSIICVFNKNAYIGNI